MPRRRCAPELGDARTTRMRARASAPRAARASAPSARARSHGARACAPLSAACARAAASLASLFACLLCAPVRVVDDARVGRDEVDTEAARARREQEDVDAAAVEALHRREAVLGADRAVEALVGEAAQLAVVLEDVELRGRRGHRASERASPHNTAGRRGRTDDREREREREGASADGRGRWRQSTPEPGRASGARSTGRGAAAGGSERGRASALHERQSSGWQDAQRGWRPACTTRRGAARAWQAGTPSRGRAAHSPSPPPAPLRNGLRSLARTCVVICEKISVWWPPSSRRRVRIRSVSTILAEAVTRFSSSTSWPPSSLGQSKR